MSIARTTIAFIGTDETSGSTISNNASATGSEVAVLGDDTSTGILRIYLVFTSTVTAGSLDVRLNPRRVTGKAYIPRSYQFAGTPPQNATGVLLYLGDIQASRYMSADVLNNGTGASATNVAVLAELYKAS